MSRKALLILAVLLIGGFGWFARSRSTLLPPQEIPSPAVSPGAGTTVTGPLSAYTIQVPEEFLMEETDDYSRLIRKKTQQPAAGPASFVYLSVVPKDKRQEMGTIYNYTPADFQKLIRSQVGDAVTLGASSDEQLNQYFRYLHVDGRMIGGYGAKAFVNAKPWEFPEGTTEYRYIIEMEPVHYIIGVYLGLETGTPDAIFSTEFEHILSTLRLTPEQVKGTPPSSSANWKSFSDPAAGLAFSYPADWQQRTEGPNFPSGDLISLYYRGDTQRPQSEMSDGVLFTVMKPVQTADTLEAWVKHHYEVEQQGLPEPPQYATVTYGGKTYQQVTVCGLGCSNTYYTKQQGKIYGVLFFAVGPHEASYLTTFQKIMESMRYS